MSPAHDVRIELDETGRGQVVLDGRDISRAVRGLRLHAGVGELTTVELELPVVVVSELSGALVLAGLEDEVRELLVELGWTPPAEEGSR